MSVKMHRHAHFMLVWYLGPWSMSRTAASQHQRPFRRVTTHSRRPKGFLSEIVLKIGRARCDSQNPESGMPRTFALGAAVVRTCLPRYQIFVPSTVFELALEPEKDPPVPDQYLHQLGCS